MKKNFDKEIQKLDDFFREYEREKSKRLKEIFEKRKPNK